MHPLVFFKPAGLCFSAMEFVGRGGRERLAAAEVLAAHLGKNSVFESVLPLSVHTRCVCHC